MYLTAVNTAYALDAATGELVWSYGTERFPARDFPAVIADNGYYFSPDDHVYALDTAAGELLWIIRSGQDDQRRARDRRGHGVRGFRIWPVLRP